MDSLIISSTKNPKLKEACKLWKRSERDASDRFLIEGYRELSRALLSEIQVETLFVCPRLFLGSNEERLIDQFYEKGTEVIECFEKAFCTLSYRDRPDGLIAVARQFHRSLENLEGSFFVVAESIEKPGNLGTILRSADAVKADGVIVCDRMTDIHNPNVVRASVGTLFTVPVVEADGLTTLQWLKEKGISILAATPRADVVYTEASLEGPIAIVVGTEQYGLSEEWMRRADLKVKIPMLGVADSLNVAMATTLLLYEARRQRDLLR